MMLAGNPAQLIRFGYRGGRVVYRTGFYEISRGDHKM